MLTYEYMLTTLKFWRNILATTVIEMEAQLLALLSITIVQTEMSVIHGNKENAGKRQLTSGAGRKHRVPLLDFFLTGIRKSWIKGLKIFLLASLTKLFFCRENSILAVFLELLMKGDAKS